MPYRVDHEPALQMPVPVRFLLGSIGFCLQPVEEGELPLLTNTTPKTIPEGESSSLAGRWDNQYLNGPEGLTIVDPCGPVNTALNSTNAPQEQDVNVVHPWKIVDYHLFLMSTQQGKDKESRRNCMYLYDGDECYPLLYRDLQDEQALDPLLAGNRPKLIFGALPIAKGGCTFSSMTYVLGFDYITGAFFARFFDWVPENLAEIWCVWDEGYDMYGLTISGLRRLLKATFSDNDNGHVNIGLLSSSDYCMARHGNDDPGMELVIAIRFCQWYIDFAEVMFTQERNVEAIKAEFTHYMGKCRAILQRASYKAWFAIGDGISIEPRSPEFAVNQFTNDLYNFCESAKDGSLEGHLWNAPSIETCNQIRQNNRQRVKEQVNRRFESIFTKPDTDSPAKSQEQIFTKMLASVEPNEQEPLYSLPPGTPKTPSPVPRRRLVESQFWSPDSDDEIVRPAVEKYDNYHEVTEYHKMPLVDILNHAIDLIRTRPELDTMENRIRVGRSLTAIGMGIKRRQEEATYITTARQGHNFNNDYAANSWKFGLMEEDLTAKPPRSLLPSPIFD